MTAGSPPDLKRQRVVSRTVAYAVAASIGLAAAYDLTSWPDWVLTSLVGAAVAGLPVVFLLIRASARRPAKEKTASSKRADHQHAPQPLGIGMVPLAATSGDVSQVSFADGFSEELLNLLAETDRIPVASASACFSLKGKPGDVKSLARKLQVSHLIDGSINRDEDIISIQVRLRTMGTGDTQWSETLEGTMKDIFALQETIVRQVGKAVGIEVQPDARESATTDNARAYEFYLTGRGYFVKGTLADLAHAVMLFSRATETDPEFVRAWVDLAETYALQVIYYEGSDAERQAADAASEKAVALAPGRGDAHAARGIAHLASEEYEEAAIECDRAIELDPSLWKAYYNYARASYHQGQMEEALGLFEKAAKINGSDYQSPLLAAPIYKRLGDAEHAEKSAREGVDRAETFLEDHPDNHRAFYLGAGALLDLGERKRAFEWAQKALAIDPSDPSIRYNMGCFYAKAGEIDQAFEYLQDSITSRSWIEHDPDLDPIREDPRYQKLLESLE
ncbi:MAG: tetratricopeptide repeat protein [Gammaproteobacteria bacterium]|jgi:TolB-like protein/tetratricopeptide (TPR) repeat protein